MLTIAASIAFLLLALATHVAVAQAGPPDVDCPSNFGGLGCTNDDQPSNGGEGDGGDENDSHTGCAQNDPTVVPAPCSHSDFVFSEEHDRYFRRLTPDENEPFRPPDGELSYLGYWTGAPDEGWMYEWRKLSGFSGSTSYDWGVRGYMWLADEPGGLQVDPEALAQAVLDGMNLQRVQIGMAPTPIEQMPDSIGLVGAPNWMWVRNPGPTTWGPITDTGSQAGVSVTVSARVEEVVWDLGDGSTVTCDSPGDPYRESYGVRESPSCGHTYHETSSDQPNQAYPVTATANWVAEWEASTGAQGALDVAPLSSTVHVRIGERQLVEQPSDRY